MCNLYNVFMCEVIALTTMTEIKQSDNQDLTLQRCECVFVYTQLVNSSQSLMQVGQENSVHACACACVF